MDRTFYPGVEFNRYFDKGNAGLVAWDRNEVVTHLDGSTPIVILPDGRWFEWSRLVPRDKHCIAEWLAGNRRLAVSRIVAHFSRFLEAE